MKVLLSAFACAPNKGSEPGVGWNWAMALSRKNEVVVLTREENREEIEKYREDHDVPFEVEYFGVEWYEKHTTIPFQKNLYTSKWQKKVVSFAKQLHERYHFDLCHHVTYASYKYPTQLFKLGIPLIVGPVGGGEKTPNSCKRIYTLKARLVETIHDFQITWATKTIGFKRMSDAAEKILVTTPDTLACMPKKIQAKCTVMQTIGMPEEEIKTEGYPKLLTGSLMRIMYVGNLIPLKGVLLLVDIAEKLKGQNIIFEIIGSGSEWQRMEMAIKQKSLESMFLFHGKVERKNVLKILDQAHAFIFPSFHDSGAMAVLESMARRVPVVALATGGPRVHVTKDTGFSVNAEQSYDGIINDFVKEIEEIKTSYEELSNSLVFSKIDAATAYLLRECAWEEKADQMQKIYSCIKKKNQDGE